MDQDLKEPETPCAAPVVGPVSSGTGARGSAEGAPLIDALEGGKKKRPSRFLNRRDTDEQVARLIENKFPDFGASAIDGKVVNGLTLRAALTNERRERKKDKGRIPASVLERLREDYADSSCPLKQLVVSGSKKEKANMDLIRALAHAHHSNPAKRSKTPLYAFFATTSTLNETELVGLLKSIATTSPSSSPAARRHILEVMKFVNSCDLDLAYGKHIAVLRRLFDEALALTWLDAKKAGERLSIWWAAHRQVSRMVLDIQQVDKIVQEGNSWQNVKVEVEAITGSSMLGAKLFWQAHGAITVANFSAEVDKVCASLRLMSVLSEGFILEQKDKLLKASASTQQSLSQEFMRRQVSLVYRGTQLSIEVVDLRDEVDYKMSAWMKELSTLGGSLVPFGPEKYLLPTPESAEGSPKLPDKFLAKFRHFRECANSHLESLKLETGREMVEALKNKLPSFSAMDRTCSIEYAWLNSMMQEGGAKLLEAKVLATLPSSENHNSLDNVISSLQLVTKSELYRFIQLASQGSTNTALEVLRDLRRASFNPKTAKLGGGFLGQVVESLQWFASFPSASGELYGQEALRKAFESLFGETVARPSTLKELELLTRFRFLLDETQQATLDTAVQRILVGSGGGGASSSKPLMAESGGAPPTKRAKRASQSKAAGDSVEDGELEADLAAVLGWFD